MGSKPGAPDLLKLPHSSPTYHVWVLWTLRAGRGLTWVTGGVASRARGSTEGQAVNYGVLPESQEYVSFKIVAQHLQKEPGEKNNCVGGRTVVGSQKDVPKAAIPRKNLAAVGRRFCGLFPWALIGSSFKPMATLP